MQISKGSNFILKGPIDSISLGIVLVLDRWQTIIWTIDDLVYWRIYTSPGFSELQNCTVVISSSLMT